MTKRIKAPNKTDKGFYYRTPVTSMISCRKILLGWRHYPFLLSALLHAVMLSIPISVMKSSDSHEMEVFFSIEEVRTVLQLEKAKIERKEPFPDPIKKTSIQPDIPQSQIKDPEIVEPIKDEIVDFFREVKKIQEKEPGKEPERFELNSIDDAVSGREVREIQEESIEDKIVKLRLDSLAKTLIEISTTLPLPLTSNPIEKSTVIHPKDEATETEPDIKDRFSGNQKVTKIKLSDPIETKFGESIAPAFLHRELPQYPLIARRLGKEGKVVLRLSIDESGNLLSVEILEKAGFGFTEAAVEAVKKSTFLPAKKDGKPVASRALLTIKFKLEGN